MEKLKSKAIIFDIDGTVMPIGDGNWPTEKLKLAVANLKDRYHISTATGRSSQYALDLIEYIGLEDDCIIAAGTEIYDPNAKQIVWIEKIPETAYSHIESVLKNNQDKCFSAQNRMEGFTGKEVVKLLDGTTSVLYLIAVDEEDAHKLTKRLQHPELQIINMHSFWGSHLRDIHVHSVKASKEHAVIELLKRLDVKKEDSIVIGDGLNDTHLFAAGGLRVAMGNAVPELKSQADLVIGDVADDGLADYLETLAED